MYFQIRYAIIISVIVNQTKGYGCMKKLMAFILTLVFAICFVGCNTQADSIGIIGGADGPTAVFVSSDIDWLQIIGFIGITAVAVFAVLIIWRKNKRK